MPLSPKVLLKVTKQKDNSHDDDQPQSRSENQVLPGVPDAGDSEDAHVPPVSTPVSDHSREDVKPIAYRKAPVKSESETGDDCCDGGCTCESGTDTATSQTTQAVADGGTTPANVNSDGELGNIDFTTPEENVSQDVENGEDRKSVV